MRCALFVLVTAAVACRSAPAAPVTPLSSGPGDAARLAGTWGLELHHGSWLPFSLGSAFGGAGRPFLAGDLRLRPVPERDSAGARIASPGFLQGQFRLEFQDQLGGVEEANFPASAMVSADGVTVIAISLGSGCAKCLELAGPVDGNRVSGDYQYRVGGGVFMPRPDAPEAGQAHVSRGQFNLRRLTP